MVEGFYAEAHYLHAVEKRELAAVKVEKEHYQGYPQTRKFEDSLRRKLNMPKATDL